MSDKPIVVVYGNPAQGVSRAVEYPEGAIFVASMDDLMNAPEDVAAAYRELVETRGTTITDLVLFKEDRTGSITDEMMNDMRNEILRIQDTAPLCKIIFEARDDDDSYTARTYFPRNEKDWQQNQKRGRMKPRRR